jgi:hypothetical protein
MKIDPDYEISEMTPDLQQAGGYLECEKVIVNNVRKQIIKGFDDKTIVNYLEKLSAYFKDRIKTSQNTSVCTNYRYVEGFINTLIHMPYWRSWIKTIDM